MLAAQKGLAAHGLFCAALALLLISRAAHADEEKAAPPPESEQSEPAPVTPSSALDQQSSTPHYGAGTHFSLSWVRLPGAENCITAKDLSRKVEERLHRPALGAPAETDVAIEGFVEPTADRGFHALVTITDRRGTLAGKRELSTTSAACREIDAALALAIALMIDPDAAFAATAEVPRPKLAVPPTPLPRREPKHITSRPTWRGAALAGVAMGFGVLPRTAEGAWVGASIEPPRLFPFELTAHLWVDQLRSLHADARATFSRATLDLAVCPLGVLLGRLGLGICGGVEGGSLGVTGIRQDGLIHSRRAIVDARVGGHVDLLVVSRVSLRLGGALQVPFIRDSFDYQHDDGGLESIFQLSAVNGDASLGFSIQVP